jgi:glycosyltransferase involved in cell wall biosynthesis
MSSERKKCLVIFPRVPYPAVGGDKLKGYHMLNILSKYYDVYLVIVTDEPYSVYEKALDYFSSLGIESKCFTYKKHNFYLNALMSVFFGKNPIQTDYYYYKSVQRFIDSIVDRFDFIICNLIRTTRYVMDVKKPKFLDIVDSIAINYSRSANNSSSRFWSTLYKIEGSRVQRYEHNCLKEFTATFFVNYYESVEAKKEFPNVYWIPNGVSEKIINYQPVIASPSKQHTIAFFGKMDYQPNIDAVVWFIKEVWPLIKNKPVFYIVGTRADALKKRFEGMENVVVTGFMEDPYQILGSVDLVIAPMQTGAGIQNKILEAMALGQVVLTSSLGANPIIGARPDEHLIIEDDPAKFAEKVEMITTNKITYSPIGANARKLIVEKYGWGNYEERLLDMINRHID